MAKNLETNRRALARPHNLGNCAPPFFCNDSAFSFYPLSNPFPLRKKLKSYLVHFGPTYTKPTGGFLVSKIRPNPIHFWPISEIISF